MEFYYIAFRSVTYARKGEALLEGAGIRCSVQRTPRWMEAQGCGYCLRLWTQEPERAVSILKDARIPMRRLYRQRSDGQLEEMAL